MIRNLRYFFIVMLVCMLAACSATSEPVSSAVPERAVAAGEAVEIQPGDTVYSVARRYKVSMRDLIDLNHLQPPFQLVPGLQITLPAKTELVDTNPEPKTYNHAFDQAYAQLNEPEPSGGVTTYKQVVQDEKATTALGAPQPLVETPITDTKGEDVHYAPQAGEALRKVSQPTAQAKPAPSPITEALQLKPMQYDKQKKELAEAPAEAKQAAAPPAPAAVAEAEVAASAVPEVKAPMPADIAPRPGMFIWPVQGSTLSGFGPKDGGTRNDGINIGAPRGTPVVAADGGTVAYAGSDIPGYGNVVLIRHPYGFITTYGHLERMFVEKDTIVAKGDMVGAIGTSGGLSTPQLHFEIRHENNALDPEKYLPKR